MKYSHLWISPIDWEHVGLGISLCAGKEHVRFWTHLLLVEIEFYADWGNDASRS